MILHNDENFKTNLPICIGGVKDANGIKTKRCPQFLSATCLIDNISCAHHANACYCPLDKFPNGVAKPVEWNELEKQSTGVPFDPQTPPAEILPLLDGEYPNNKQWAKWPNVQAAYRLALAQTAQTFSDYPTDKFHGKGIVIPAGGALLEAAYVTIRVLRFVGCTLPIELWHLPNETLDDWHLAALQGLGVTVINAGDVAKEHPWRRIGGWELKAYAVLHSQFEHVLLLDADCYPIRNPVALFDSPEYQSAGAIFWPDTESYDLTVEQCSILGLEYVAGKPDIESGEFFVDKRRCWKEIQLANWINQHSDFYYQIFHGDKTTFNLAWQHLGRKYAMPPGRWNYLRPAMIQKDFAGYPLFVHRSEGKLILDEKATCFGEGRTGQLDAKNRYNPKIPLEDVAWKFLEDLREIRDRHHNHGFIFGGIYQRNEWGVGSGPGSAPAATTQYRELLEKIIHNGKIKRVVDLGCGDWQFSQHINWKGVDYLGVDCVRSLIDENQRKYGAENIRFQYADLMEFEPPPCDLILVKDVLQHWPTGDIKTFLARMAGKEMLVTNTVEQPRQRATNSEIKAGDFRPLDITAAPYNVAQAKILLDWVSNIDDRKQTLLVPGAINLIHGALGLTRALVGKPGSRIAKNRQEICDQCDKAVKALGLFQKCGVCGCHVTSKSKIPGEACPIGKWPKVGTRIAFVQLGRAGDILILIPALKFLAEMGVQVKLITRPEYAPVAFGIPEVDVVEYSGKVEDWQGAEIFGRTIADEVRVTQCGFNDRKRVQPNFALEGFYHTGVPVSLFNNLPLVLENRDKATEKKIVAEYGDKPILFNANGNSTPYANGKALLDELKNEIGEENILDLGAIKAPRIQDLLGLYEQAKVLVSTDTATLHLGYAVGIPTVALVSDYPGGASPTRAHWIERLTYKESKTEKGRDKIIKGIRECLTPKN